MQGKSITLTGYVLPLKIAAGRATEFYLIPSPATCTHAAPPPPNQIVYVKSGEGVASQGRFTAVRVSGQIEARQTERTIQRVDGPRKLTAAYVIEPTEIEVYQTRK